MIKFLFLILFCSTSFAATTYDNSSTLLTNVGIKAAVASSALTISLVQADGTSNPAQGSSASVIGFKSSTATSGGYSLLSVTGAKSITVPATATLGQVSGASENTYVFAQNNAGVIQLCVSTSNSFGDNSSQTSTTISSGATSRTVLYCVAGATGTVRLLGMVTSTQSTAGTWVTSPSAILIMPFFAPYGSVNTSATTATREEFGYFAGASSTTACTSSPCTLYFGTTPGVSSITRSSLATYVVNFSPSFSQPPQCFFTVSTASTYDMLAYILPGVAPTVSTYSFGTMRPSGEVQTDTYGSFHCIGPK